MLLSRLLLRRNKSDSEDDRGSCVLMVFILVIIATILVKITQWVLPDPTVPLLPQADGMIQAVSVEQAQTQTGEPILMPSDLQGSSVAVVGLYPAGGPSIPPGSVAIILEKNDWRFVEIFETHGLSLEETLAAYGTNPKDEVVLTHDVSGQLVQTPRWYLQCVPGAEDHPGVCQITKALVFETDGMIITISADGNHATEGELIALAKSMLPK